jgi:hypothetical protein
MSAQMERDGVLLLKFLAEYALPTYANPEEDTHRGCHLLSDGHIKATLPPRRALDAAVFLEDNGCAHVNRFNDGKFNVWLTPLGQYQYKLLMTTSGDPDDAQSESPNGPRIPRLPAPIGSPYGFTDHDWEYIDSRNQEQGQLRVVFGYQFRSDHYDSIRLVENLKHEFEGAVDQYNSKPGHDKISLDFKELRAGLGEHVFNQIVRDIISSHIAIFETSDQNPNVMIEMGIALTWGVRVLPIRAKGRPQPPSDISGQTWAVYRNSGDMFCTPDFRNAVEAMIARAMRKGWAG